MYYRMSVQKCIPNIVVLLRPEWTLLEQIEIHDIHFYLFRKLIIRKTFFLQISYRATGNTKFTPFLKWKLKFKMRFSFFPFLHSSTFYIRNKY